MTDRAKRPALIEARRQELLERTLVVKPEGDTYRVQTPHRGRLAYGEGGTPDAALYALACFMVDSDHGWLPDPSTATYA